MIRSIRAELRRMATLRTTGVLVVLAGLGTVALDILLAAATASSRLSGSTAGLVLPRAGGVAWARGLLALADQLDVLALVVGVLAVTTEYRYRTITGTLLAEPRRGRVVAGKVVAAAAAGLGAGVVAMAGGAVGTLAACAIDHAGAHGVHVVLDQLRTVAPGVVASYALFGVLGAGIGALLRNQVAALVSGLAFTVILDGVVALAVPVVGRFLPDEAANALSVAGSGFSAGGASHVALLPWWGGALVLAAWGLGSAVVGSLTAIRADIT